jgi:hypothetical protein
MMQKNYILSNDTIILISRKFYIFCKYSFQVAANLYQCVVANWQFAMYSHANARLEMCGKRVLCGHA